MTRQTEQSCQSTATGLQTRSEHFCNDGREEPDVFEEAQLYSPVTSGEDGSVTVHLAHDHPGANDPAYSDRRNEIAAAALAWKPGEPSPRIEYTELEQNVWRTVCRELPPKWDQYAINEFRDGVAALELPRNRVPELDEV